MDFSSIETFSEDKINEIYDNLLNNSEQNLLSEYYCSCKNTTYGEFVRCFYYYNGYFHTQCWGKYDQRPDDGYCYGVCTPVGGVDCTYTYSRTINRC